MKKEGYYQKNRRETLDLFQQVLALLPELYRARSSLRGIMEKSDPRSPENDASSDLFMLLSTILSKLTIVDDRKGLEKAPVVMSAGAIKRGIEEFQQILAEYSDKQSHFEAILPEHCREFHVFYSTLFGILSRIAAQHDHFDLAHIPTHYRYPVLISKGKVVHLTITYGQSVSELEVEHPLNVLLEQSIIKEVSLPQWIEEVNLRVVAAIEKVYSTALLERFYGTSFRTNLIIYIIAKLQGEAVVPKLIKLFKGVKEPIEFRPDPKDSRMMISVEKLLRYTKQGDLPDVDSLATDILHEITHVFDFKRKGIETRPESALLAARFKQIRIEGLALFAEALENPAMLRAYQSPLGRIDFNHSSLSTFNMIMLPQAEYVLGMAVMLQLFLARIKKEWAIQQLSYVGDLLRAHRAEALALLQHVRQLDHRQFFDLYYNTVKVPLFEQRVEW